MTLLPDFLVFYTDTSLKQSDGLYHNVTHCFRETEADVRKYFAKWHLEYVITRIARVG